MTVYDAVQFFRQRFPEQLQETYDNSGIQIIQGEAPLTGIFLSLDISMETILRAHESGCNLICTHHPLLFKPLSRIDVSNYRERLVFELIQRKISLYSIHTTMDRVYCLKTAALLGLENASVLFPDFAGSETGFGSMGTLADPESFGDFLKTVATAFGSPYLTYTGNEKRLIKTAAVVNGSGASQIYSLFDRGIDCVITGDVKYHEAHDACKAGLCLVDAGHFWTERFFMDHLYDELFKFLTEAGKKTAMYVDCEEKNPLKLFVSGDRDE